MNTRLIAAIACSPRERMRDLARFFARHFDGEVLLFELDDQNRGLVPALIRPSVKRLRVVPLPLGRPAGRALMSYEQLPNGLRSHYYSMRDDGFVQRLAEELDAALGC